MDKLPYEVEYLSGRAVPALTGVQPIKYNKKEHSVYSNNLPSAFGLDPNEEIMIHVNTKLIHDIIS